MKYSFTFTKLFAASLGGLVIAAIYGGVAPQPAHACGVPTETQLFCSAAGTAPPGFGTTFQNNLVDPLGGQCTAGGPGCTNDTFVDPGVGDCTDGSTGCNAGGDLLLPVSNAPCVSCFAEPGQVGSLFGGQDDSLQPTRDYLSTQRRVLDFQRGALIRSRNLAENTANARRQNTADIANSRARINALGQQFEDLPRNSSDEAVEAVERAIKAEETRLTALLAEGRRLEGIQALADANVETESQIVEATEANIAEVERTGNVPQSPGGLLTQFGGGGEATQEPFRMLGGENSTYNKAVANGGYIFDLSGSDARGTTVSMFFDGDVGTQFVRSATGHSSNPSRTNPDDGVISGTELFDKPFLVTHQYMQGGVKRKLADAVRRGEVAGTIEVVPLEDDPGRGTKEVITILPEGLEAAKPYLDVQDSLFEGALEEDARTTSDSEREREQDRRESEEREYRRQAERRERERQSQQPANPVQSKDVQDNTKRDGFHSVIDEIEGVISLA